MLTASRLIAFALLGVIVGLLAVGVVSGTMVRHIVQVLPATLALVFVVRRAAWSSYAAAPIFVIWLLIMLAIWLYLLGLARITTGHFSPIEIGLTLEIGASCLCGLSQSFRSQWVAGRFQCAASVVIFTALQIGAVWVSLRPALAEI